MAALVAAGLPSLVERLEAGSPRSKAEAGARVCCPSGRRPRLSG